VSKIRTVIEDSALPSGWIKYRSETTGKITFQVTAGVVNGKKMRQEFGEHRYGSVRNALAAAKNWESEMEREIRVNRSSVIELPPRDRWVYLAYIEKIREAGMTLQECIEEGLKRRQEHTVKRSITVQHAVEEFLRYKRAQKCRESYFKSMGPMLKGFAKGFDGAKLNEITHEQIEEFLGRRQISDGTWNNWRRDLRTLFNFAKSERNGWIKVNPAESIVHKKVDRGAVTILQIDEAKKLNEAKKVLAKAVEFYPRLVPFLALGMFGGIRREELQNAQWEDIHWEHGTVEVHSAKNRDVPSRYVHMQPVLVAWLTKYRQESGPICTMQYARRNDLQALSIKTGVDCSDNIYRHSFGSYHYAAFEDKQKTMLEMGHTSQATFDRYYKRAIPKRIALTYWELTPEVVLPAA